MGIRQIRKEGDEILKKKCKPVKEITPAVLNLLDDMIETLRNVKALGIAAPQVGALKRIAVIEHEEDLYELINPEIIEKDGSQVCNEACLSIPGLCGDIDRPFKITVQAQNRLGETYTIDVDDFLASAFCHEIDHLNGVLFIDSATNVQPLEPEQLEERRRGRRRKRK